MCRESNTVQSSVTTTRRARLPVKKLIVVMGPHRSGTSLCTHALQVLGATTGLEEVYASDENVKGFFEHERIILLNEALLAALGGSWDNAGFNGAAAITATDLTDFRRDAVKLFQELFADAECVVLKDPRMCQLLPFWEEVFVDCGFSREQLFYVHALRHPVEVALSQQSRVLKNPTFYEFGRNIHEGAALWLSLTAQSLLNTRGRNNFIVSYHDFLQAPESRMEKLSAYLGVESDPVKVKEFCQRFVDRALHRSKVDADVQAKLQKKLPQALEVYEALLPLCGQGVFSDKDIKHILDILRRETTWQTILSAQIDALSRLNTRNREAQTLLAAARQELTSVREEFMVNSEVLAKKNKVLTANNKVLMNKNEVLVTKNEGLAIRNEELTIKNEELMMRNEVLTNMSEDFTAMQKTFAVTLEELSATQEKVAQLERYCYRSFRSRLARLMSRMRNLLLRVWLYSRKSLVSLAIKGSSRHPKAVHTLRRIASPAIRLVDRLAFRFLAVSSPQNTNTPNFATLYQQGGIVEQFEPLVTVIVPNYDHAPYLKERLESIYQQSYRNFEVILMDDCSTDGSVAILESFQRKYPEQTRLLVNEKNSGGVFHQWEKGIQFARGEILWIAESDDYCTENFLVTLVPMFRNEAVMVAYSRTDFVRSREGQPFWSISEYLHDIDPNRWSNAFVETAHDIVNTGFAVKNIIPNVSSALFRKTEQLEILHDENWKKMRTCGDWVLYLHLLRGGMLAYSPDATNYYRIHDKNTSVSSYTQDSFYREHEFVARTICRYYDVPMATLERQKQQLVTHWRQSRDDYTDERFAQCYSLERVEQETSGRMPNLLMAGYAFCAGGGETFPILLANLMKARGYNVTFLDCNQVPRVDDIRFSLRSDIPVVTSLAHVRQIVERFNIDLIHSQHAWVDCSIAELVKESEPQPCSTVVTMHGMYEMMPGNSAKHCLSLLRKHTAQIVYTAEKNLAALREHGLYDPATTTRIDNALDIYPFTPVGRDTLGIPQEAFVLTLVSRAVPEKGWNESVDAINKARKLSGKDIHLILIGEGPAYNELSGKLLPSHIHLEGFRKNIRDYFAVSDLAFLPSRFKGESFPLVLIDAFHAGTPVLASAVGEIPYMIETDRGMAGVLFDLNKDWSIDIDALAASIASLATDNSLYGKLKSNVSHAAAKFDPDNLCRAYDVVYRRALAGA